MRFETKNISVVTDGAFIKEIRCPQDQYGMNWTISDHDWGKVFGLEIKKTYDTANASYVLLKGDNITMRVKRRLVGNKFVDTYYVKNTSPIDYFITQETFGIIMPVNCLQQRWNVTPDMIHHLATAHVWCGDSVCWLYGAKFSGEGPHLVVNMTEGNVSDYSISRDVAAVPVGADYRGDIVLNPTPCVLAPGEVKKYEFEYFFVEKDVKKALMAQKDFIMVQSDLYTLSQGMTARLTATYNGKEEIRVFLDGTPVPTTRSGNVWSWTYTANELGQHNFDIYAGTRHTVARLFTILPVKDLLIKRADFITKNQQFHKVGSHLDGAYLIYDNETKSTYYNKAKGDHNASRERIGMGILVARSLQLEYNEERMASLKKHFDFVMRELYDEERAYIYYDAGKYILWPRYYNYPWFALYFLEWFNLTGEKRHAINAAKCMMRYYKKVHLNELYAQCQEPLLILEALEKAGETELYQKFRRAVVRYLNKIYNSPIHKVKPGECCIVSEQLNDMACYLAHAALLTGKQKYLRAAKVPQKASFAMVSFQPDFRLAEVPVRHWDRYWFGKHPQHGDVFPHYWSTLHGVAHHWLMKATGKDYSAVVNNNLRNNLCLFNADGSAYNNYLYPYKVFMYNSKESEGYVNQWMETGIHTGKNYDMWANDQDWALYFAERYLV